MSSSDSRAEIAGVIRRINAAWREAPPGANDATSDETGHELFVFTRHGSEWLIVWRAMLPAPT
jgi:hypothetical protein